MSRMADFYDAVFQVLKDDAEIAALVAEENIRPSEDPAESPTGNMIYYGWTGGRWDEKRRRGEGTFAVSVGAVDNKVKGGELLDLVRAALTAKALTEKATGVTVALFAEEDAFTDAGTTDSNRYQAAAVFKVRMMEAA